mmetsp:Transcript_19979/g.39244  ORF Transcript_19979/g.39244 Transcript_19979/m.39244 type:complete len:228 (+) Transcript_19979:1566-2249(+)
MRLTELRWPPLAELLLLPEKRLKLLRRENLLELLCELVLFLRDADSRAAAAAVAAAAAAATAAAASSSSASSSAADSSVSSSSAESLASSSASFCSSSVFEASSSSLASSSSASSILRSFSGSSSSEIASRVSTAAASVLSSCIDLCDCEDPRLDLTLRKLLRIELRIETLLGVICLSSSFLSTLTGSSASFSSSSELLPCSAAFVSSSVSKAQVTVRLNMSRAPFQ